MVFHKNLFPLAIGVPSIQTLNLNALSDLGVAGTDVLDVELRARASTAADVQNAVPRQRGGKGKVHFAQLREARKGDERAGNDGLQEFLLRLGAEPTTGHQDLLPDLRQHL